MTKLKIHVTLRCTWYFLQYCQLSTGQALFVHHLLLSGKSFTSVSQKDKGVLVSWHPSNLKPTCSHLYLWFHFLHGHRLDRPRQPFFTVDVPVCFQILFSGSRFPFPDLVQRGFSELVWYAFTFNDPPAQKKD